MEHAYAFRLEKSCTTRTLHDDDEILLCAKRESNTADQQQSNGEGEKIEKWWLAWRLLHKTCRLILLFSRSFLTEHVIVVWLWQKQNKATKQIAHGKIFYAIFPVKKALPGLPTVVLTDYPVIPHKVISDRLNCGPGCEGAYKSCQPRGNCAALTAAGLLINEPMVDRASWTHLCCFNVFTSFRTCTCVLLLLPILWYC